MKYFLISLFLFLNIEASSLKVDTAKFEVASNKYDISSILLLALAMIESNLDKNAIGSMPKSKYQKEKLHKFLTLIKCKYLTSKDEGLFSIYPINLAEAQKVLLILNHFNIGYDIGLTQINVWNIKRRSLNQSRLLSDEYYSIDIGAKILRECIKYNKGNVHNSIECYNKGTDKKKYNRSYSTKVLAKYEELKLKLK